MHGRHPEKRRTPALWRARVSVCPPGCKITDLQNCDDTHQSEAFDRFLEGGTPTSGV
jgi:hypothetical protein